MHSSAHVCEQIDNYHDRHYPVIHRSQSITSRSNITVKCDEDVNLAGVSANPIGLLSSPRAPLSLSLPLPLSTTAAAPARSPRRGAQGAPSLQSSLNSSLHRQTPTQVRYGLIIPACIYSFICMPRARQQWHLFSKTEQHSCTDWKIEWLVNIFLVVAVTHTLVTLSSFKCQCVWNHMSLWGSFYIKERSVCRIKTVLIDVN